MGMRWVTKDIIFLIANAGYKAKAYPQGGDVDTDNIIVPIGKEHLHISGFITNGEINTPNDCEVEMVELTDGQDSRGGLNSTSEEVADAYIKIRQLLLNKNFVVVPNMGDYF